MKTKSNLLLLFQIHQDATCIRAAKLLELVHM